MRAPRTRWGRGQRLRSRRLALPGAPARGWRAGGEHRPRRRQPARRRGRGGRLLQCRAPREPRACCGARAGVARAAPRRAAGRAERAAAHDCGGGHARQDDHRVDARPHPARRRHRPRLAGGRSGGRRPAQRALGRGRVAGGGGRRVRPLDALARGGDRGAHQRGARPPRELCLAGGAAHGVPCLSRARSQRHRGVGSSRVGGAGAGGGVRGGVSGKGSVR